MYLELRDLPPVVQSVLAREGWHKPIQVTETATIAPKVYADDHERGRFIVINLVTGQSETATGLFGGANQWSNCLVDLDETEYPIPANCVVLKGGSFLHLYVAPGTLVKALPPVANYNVIEMKVLYAHRALNGGEPRREFYRKHLKSSLAPVRTAPASLESWRASQVANEFTETLAQEICTKLMGCGLLKKVGKGTAITVDGRNALDHYLKSNGLGFQPWY